jgi:hypothetical protein
MPLVMFNLKRLNPIAGHGRRVEFKDHQEKNSTLEAFVQNKSTQLP